ncbi:MAG: NAD-dependent epimerase/dehydratase family protein [Sphingobacteriaceae bacterium]|nr:MAG: NAD-dependent epimerase/dehydratase family protein [Sphingobacteriaceae bacterium]
MPHKVIVAGATGLVGSLLLELLLHHPDISEVLVLSRKQLPIQNQKLKQLVIDFDRLEDYQSEINGDAIFCCLGTTRKKTPDLKIYRKIDHDYPVELAKIGDKNSIPQFHLISSLGANVNSFAFYTKLKGETERDVKATQLPSIYIYQPSFLVGNRSEKRFGERFGMNLFKLINPFLIGRLKKYRSISAEVVAKAMLNEFLKNKTGVFTYPSDQIKKLA